MFHYSLKFWDEIDCKESSESGIVAASSYSEAIEEVTEFYGLKNIIRVELAELDKILTSIDLKDLAE